MPVRDVWQEASQHIVGYFEKLTLERVLTMNKNRVMAKMLSGDEFSV